MPNTYDWSSFYQALCQHGPNLLLGIDDEVREIIAMTAETSDMYWSDGMEEQMAIGAEEGLRAGVLAALEVWRENVLAALDSNFGILLDRGTVRINKDSPLLIELEKAAKGTGEA